MNDYINDYINSIAMIDVSEDFSNKLPFWVKQLYKYCLSSGYVDTFDNFLLELIDRGFNNIQGILMKHHRPYFSYLNLDDCDEKEKTQE